MTTPGRDSRDLGDPALDAAWRAASAETPPPALDAAILAAAHRAVNAGPQRAAARAPWRWWTPLAAAAAIGAVAIGVLQLAPEDRDATPSAVSDAPRVAARAPSQAETQAPPPAAGTSNAAPAAAASKVQAPYTEPAPQAPRAKNEAMPPASTASTMAMQKDRAATLSASQAAGGAAPSPAAAGQVAPSREAAGAAAPAPADIGGKSERDAAANADAARKQKAMESPTQPDPFPGAKSTMPAPPPAAAPAPPPAPIVAQPERQNALQERRYADQAAAKAPAERAGNDVLQRSEAVQDLKKDAVPAANPASPPPVPPAAMAPAPSAPAAPSPARTASAGFTRDPATQLTSQQGVSRGDAAPLTAAQQAAAVRSRAQSKEELESKLAQGGAPAAAAPQAKAMTDKARSPDDYVASIRRLLAAGDNDAAKRELVAFRAAYADADARVPPDLRSWAAAVPR